MPRKVRNIRKGINVKLLSEKAKDGKRFDNSSDNSFPSLRKKSIGIEFFEGEKGLGSYINSDFIEGVKRVYGIDIVKEYKCGGYAFDVALLKNKTLLGFIELQCNGDLHRRDITKGTDLRKAKFCFKHGIRLHVLCCSAGGKNNLKDIRRSAAEFDNKFHLIMRGCSAFCMVEVKKNSSGKTATLNAPLYVSMSGTGISKTVKYYNESKKSKNFTVLMSYKKIPIVSCKVGNYNTIVEEKISENIDKMKILNRELGDLIMEFYNQKQEKRQAKKDFLPEDLMIA